MQLKNPFLFPRTACNNTRRHFTRPLTDLRTRRKFPRPQKFRRQTHIYHQAMPQTTTQHNFTPLTEIITSDNLERRSKITRDITMTSTTVTTTRITRLT